MNFTFEICVGTLASACRHRMDQINTGLPLVREKSGKFKVREMSGNFVIGQGNFEF